MLDLKNHKVYVYGTGSFARRIISELENQDVSIFGTIDHVSQDNTNSGQLLHFHSSKVELEDGDIVVLGVCNLHGNLREISDQLLAINPRIEVVSPVQLARYLKQQEIDFSNYWLTGDIDVYKKNQMNIEMFRNLLADSQSKSTLDSIIKYRTNGFIDDLEMPEPLSSQYLPKDLLTPPTNLNILEMGSLHGEDLVRIIDSGRSLESGFALEPDLHNYRQLIENLRSKNIGNIVPLPLGAWDATDSLRFNASGASGAHLSPEGEQVVSVICPDDLVNRVPINYIKMDIEGAEGNALYGSQQIIKENTPHLAISIYHVAEHLWELGLQIEKMAQGKYNFHLRVYGFQTFDTILYCIPR
jgi:FkbM family methyltransferase